MHAIRLTRRQLLALGTAVGAPPLQATAQSSASGFPNKPVRILIGFPAGTGPDIMARTIGQRLAEKWGGAAVVIENKVGAAGIIAAAEAAQAPGDGHTLMLAEVGQMCIAPHVYRKLNYDPQKDFAPLTIAARSGFVLLVDPQRVAARNVRDFIVHCKKQPKGVFMGTFGAGTPGHFAAHIFSDKHQLNAEPVHYRSTADALVGLSSGDVQGVFASVGLSIGQIKAGRLVGIGSTAHARFPVIPDIATMREQGFPELELAAWSGFVAPAKTPTDLLDRLNADINLALKSPEVKAKLEELGSSAGGTTRQDMAKTIAADSVLWGSAVAATGFKID